MNIGYIGIGIMGQPMAANLLKAGHNLFIYNRTASKCQPLAQAGAAVCANSAEVAAQSEVVFINVTDTPDVQQVLFGPQGIAQRAQPGLTVIDNSTISPVATVEFARQLQQIGVDYLDAPVSGGDIGAQQGTLAIMVGGEKEVYQRCLGLLNILGSKVSHLGPVGSGQTCKACNQLFCAIHMVAVCEGITLAEKAGLDPQKMIEIVANGAGGSWALKNLGPKIMDNDLEPAFMIDLLVKDLKLVMELATKTQTVLTGTALAEQLFFAAQNQGAGKKGTQALIETIRQLNG